MVIVMNMSSYEIECDPAEAGNDRRALYFGQNSVPELGLQTYVSTNHRHGAMPADLVSANPELFLRRM
jgi:hypothetical protein